MGRKRRKKVRTRPKPTLPTVFECPHCGNKTVHVEINRRANLAKIACSSCEIIADERPVGRLDEPVDIFHLWFDEVMERESQIETELKIGD